MLVIEFVSDDLNLVQAVIQALWLLILLLMLLMVVVGNQTGMPWFPLCDLI